MKIEMQILYVPLMIILFCTSSQALGYSPPEVVYYEDKSYDLSNSGPLDCCCGTVKKFLNGNTDISRVYGEMWEIKDGKLYLFGAWILGDDGKWDHADLGVLFGDWYIDDRVEAVWFTGELHLKDGNKLEHDSDKGIFKHKVIYERDMVIKIESGRVAGIEIIDNRKKLEISVKNAPLFQAIENGNLSEVRALLDKGADINAEDINTELTPLITAYDNGQGEIVKLLIERGTDVNAVGADGLNVLMRASYSNNLEWIKSLIEKGADVNANNDGGETALFHASRIGNIDVVKLLLDEGADVNVTNICGDTALSQASLNGHIDVVRMLLDNGADVNYKNINGVSALKLARMKGYTEIVQMLEKAGTRE